MSVEIPSNLYVVARLDSDEAYAVLSSGSSIHATNGAYGHDLDKLVPKMLAGYQYITDRSAMMHKNDILFIGVNSNGSFENFLKSVGAPQSAIDNMKDQEARAMEVAVPLALQHPDRKVVVMYYDELTPVELYTSLCERNISIQSLHKWKYGTDENAPRKIEGAHLATFVFGFPEPDDTRPVFYDQTPIEKQPAVIVRKLTEEKGPHGSPYLSMAGKIQFPIMHRSLERYTEEGTLFDRMNKLSQRIKPEPSAP